MSATRPVAAIAGASRGLGLLIAHELQDAGYALALSARGQQGLDAAAEQLGGAVHTTACDVSDRAAVTAWISAVERDLGPVEVAICVAGIIQVGPAEDITVDLFDQAIEVMTKGPVNLTFAVLPGMRARRSGRIGIVTSLGGVISAPHLWPYATAKFGAVGFSDGLAAALTGTGVSATTIVPGLMRTGSQVQARFVGNQVAEANWFSVAATLPLLSSGPRRAARRIVAAVLRGSPLVVIGPLTQLAIRVRGLAPGLTTRLMGLLNLALPRATGRTDPVPGSALVDQQPALIRWLTSRKG